MVGKLSIWHVGIILVALIVGICNAQTEAPAPDFRRPTSSSTQAPTQAPTGGGGTDSTPAPTPSPTGTTTTQSPTLSPTTTQSPTLSPTTTQSPTLSPTTTQSPTLSPTTTQSPTLSPTTTQSPTLSPTLSPTATTSTPEPTQSPTNPTPTQSPTLSPTATTPTQSPTQSPTNLTPTHSPTLSPTGRTPTPKPTQSPTRRPTTSPTPSPNGNPTISPTQSPVVPTVPLNGVLTPTGGYCDGEFIEFPEWSGLTISSLAFSILGILLGLGGVLFIFKYRDRPIIRMSQPTFLAVFCFALATLNAGLVVMILGETHPTSLTCMASFGLIEISLVFINAALGVKEWRAWKVRFKSMKFQKVKISDKFLYCLLAASVSVIIIILIPWFIVAPPVPDPCHQFYCELSSAWFLASWLYILLIILATTTIAFIARDVPSVGAEAAGILYVSIFISFILIFLTMILAIGNISYDLQTWCVAFGVLWITACYLLLIVFRKYAWINMSRQDINATFLSSSKFVTLQSEHTTNAPQIEKEAGMEAGNQPQHNGIGTQHTQKEPSYNQSISTSTASEVGFDFPLTNDSQTQNEKPAVIPQVSKPLQDRRPQEEVEAAGERDQQLQQQETSSTTVPSHATSSSSSSSSSSCSGRLLSPIEGRLVSDEELIELTNGAFLIAERENYIELIDREDGSTFWIHIPTQTVYTEPPHKSFLVPT